MKYLIFIFLLSSCAMTGSKPQRTLVQVGHLFDSQSGQWLKDQTLLMEEGRIVAVNPKVIPPHTKTIDYGQSYVVPGLIDAHSHVFLNDPTYTKDFAAGLLLFVTETTDEQRKKMGEARLKSLLRHGFTSVRDLGNSGDIDAKDFQEVGPRIYSSYQGYAPKYGQFPPGTSKALLENEYRPMTPTPPDFFRGAVVKLYADEDPNQVVADEAIFKKWVKKAHEKGLMVAAHATLKASIQVAINAHVDSIEHGTFITDGQLKEMHEKGILFVPTNADSLFLHGHLKKYQWDYTAKLVHETCSTMKRARERGVEVSFGSDNYFSLEGDGVSFGESTMEILLSLKECGLSMTEVLRAATYLAAKAMGQERVLGQLSPGAYADFIVLSGDPAVEVQRLKKPLAVYKNGREVLTGRPSKEDR